MAPAYAIGGRSGCYSARRRGWVGGGNVHDSESVAVEDLAAACMLGLASIVSAQITTGTLTGTVRDKQGGVVPGATVILISESQRHEVVAGRHRRGRRFRVRELRADTYTIEVTMPSFKTLKRAGVQVSPGERVSVGAARDRGRRRDGSRRRQGRSAARAVELRRALVHDRRPTRSRTCRLPGRSFTQLASLAPGVTGTSRIGDRSSTGGGDTNIQMDGVSTMDTGSNRAIIDLNVESIAEVKVLVSNYQAEFGRSSGLQITAVTKSGTNRFRGSVYDVERNSDWNANSRTNILNGDPKTVLRQRDWGYSIGGPVGKPGGSQQAVLLLHAGVRAAHRRQRRGPVSRADRARAAGGLLADRPTTTATRIRTSRTRRCTATCTAASQAACFADGGVLGRIPASQLYQTGLNILKMWPLPNIDNAGGPAVQLRDHAAVGEHPEHAAGDALRLSAATEAPRQLQVLGIHPARAGAARARFPAGTTPAW